MNERWHFFKNFQDIPCLKRIFNHKKNEHLIKLYELFQYKILKRNTFFFISRRQKNQYLRINRPRLLFVSPTRRTGAFHHSANSIENCITVYCFLIEKRLDGRQIYRISFSKMQKANPVICLRLVRERAYSVSGFPLLTGKSNQSRRLRQVLLLAVHEYIRRNS